MLGSAIQWQNLQTSPPENQNLCILTAPSAPPTVVFRKDPSSHCMVPIIASRIVIDALGVNRFAGLGLTTPTLCLYV